MSVGTENASVTLVAAFVETNGAKRHEAFGLKTYFNQRTEEYEAQIEESSTRAPYHDLQHALREYQEKTGLDLGFDISHCTWEDVLRQMHDAKERSVAGDKGRAPGNLLRRGFRKMGVFSPIVMPVLEAIPDDNGLSVLHGGLALIFTIARHRQEIRHKIMHSFEEIPDIIDMAEKKREAFPEREDLRECVKSLYSTLFEVLPALIHLLLPKSIGSKLKSPFKLPVLEEMLQKVKHSADRVKTCSDGIRDVYAADTRRLATDHHKQLQEVQKTVETAAAVMGRDLSKVENTIDERHKELAYHLDEIKELALSMKNGLFQVLKDEFLKFMYYGPPTHSQPGPPPWAQAFPRVSGPPHLTPDDVVLYLNVPHAQALQDQKYVLRQGAKIDGKVKAHAYGLIHTEAFRRWCDLRHSDLLLVNGNLDTRDMGRLSPMTYMCASLTEVFREVVGGGGLVTLQFFCGEHTASNDALAGPIGMIRCLMEQLVVQCQHLNPAMGIEVGDGTLAGLQHHRAEALCDAFGRVLRQLPPDSVTVCIIDAVSMVERSQWAEEYDVVLRCLTHLADADYASASGPHFKLFLTSPSKSRWTARLRPEQRVELRRGSRAQGFGAEKAFLKAVAQTLLPGARQ